MGEHFLRILHSIEEITDTTPLRDAARQLPKQIYDIIRSEAQMTTIPEELTDQLVFDLAKTYYYSVIECLCKLIKSIQQICYKQSANSTSPNQPNFNGCYARC